MKKSYCEKVFLCCLLCLLATVPGCYVQVGGWAMPAKHERKVQLSAALAAGSIFTAKTHNGSITVRGADTPDCKLDATIIARAATEQEAQELAEKVDVRLTAFGSHLTAKIEKPAFMVGKAVTVNLDVIVPYHAAAELTTHNGPVDISNITGGVKGKTHNGSVGCRQIGGDLKFETHNGDVTARDIEGSADVRTHNGHIAGRRVRGHIRVKTHNGPVTFHEVPGDFKAGSHNGTVKVTYAETARSSPNVSIVTRNGGIDLTAPPGFSASVQLLTHNGSIKTDLPITVIGNVNKRRLRGTIGAGDGRLHLETHNGSIRIR